MMKSRGQSKSFGRRMMKSSHFKQGSIFSRDKDTASTVSDFKFFSIEYEILDRLNFNFFAHLHITVLIVHNASCTYSMYIVHCTRYSSNG
jgi:hypothetical protein